MLTVEGVVLFETVEEVVVVLLLLLLLDVGTLLF